MDDTAFFRLLPILEFEGKVELAPIVYLHMMHEGYYGCFSR